VGGLVATAFRENVFLPYYYYRVFRFPADPTKRSVAGGRSEPKMARRPPLESVESWVAGMIVFSHLQGIPFVLSVECPTSHAPRRVDFVGDPNRADNPLRSG